MEAIVKQDNIQVELKMTKEELDSIILCIGKISEYDYTSKGAKHEQAEAMFSLYQTLKQATRK